MQQGRLLSLLVHSTSKFELFVLCTTGADPGFQVRGLHLKKLRRAKGGAKIVGVFRVKNHDFTPKNHIFSNFRGRAPPSGSAPEVGDYCLTPNELFSDISCRAYERGVQPVHLSGGTKKGPVNLCRAP